MASIISQILLCLIIAGILGGIIGWLLRGGGSGSGKVEALEASWRSRYDDKTKEIEGLHSKFEEHERTVQGLHRRIGDVSTHAKGWEAMVHGRDHTMIQLEKQLAQCRASAHRLRTLLHDVENHHHTPAPAVPGRDDLKDIAGVGPVLERLLNQNGVYSFRQIAVWTQPDVDAMSAKLEEFKDRIRREHWVTQAKELHFKKYNERI
jgi:predicted flap endonuclease-1-like 5' DNA nuclease